MTWSVSLYVGWLVGLTEIISLKRREVSLFHAPIGALVLLRIKAWRNFILSFNRINKHILWSLIKTSDKPTVVCNISCI